MNKKDVAQARRRRDAPLLAAALSDPDPKVVADAANAIWGLSDEPTDEERAVWLEALRPQLTHPNPTVRGNVISALAALGSETRDEEVLAGLHDQSSEVRMFAAAAGRDAGTPAVTQRLLELVADDDWLVRQQAAGALGHIGDASTVPYLEKRLEEESDEDVQAAIRETLDQLEANDDESLLPPKPRRRRPRSPVKNFDLDRLAMLFLFMPMMGWSLVFFLEWDLEDIGSVAWATIFFGSAAFLTIRLARISFADNLVWALLFVPPATGAIILSDEGWKTEDTLPFTLVTLGCWTTAVVIARRYNWRAFK